MRKWKSVIACALATLLLMGCEPEQTSKHRAPQEKPAATNAQQPRAHDPEANQPGPQKDPGACNDRGERDIELQAHWQSEGKVPPTAVWTQNGRSTPFTNVVSHKNEKRGYDGEVSKIIRAKCKDILSVNVKGDLSTYMTICVIIDLGQDVVHTGKRQCAAVYTVP